MARTRYVQVFNALIDDLNFGLHALWCEHLGNFGRYFLVCERSVDVFDDIFYLFFWQLYLL